MLPIERLKKEWSNLSQEEIYMKIIDLGRAFSPLEESLKEERWLVPGCQSRTYLISRCSDTGQMYFLFDSDALISKGLAALVVSIYSGLTPKEALLVDLSWMEELGLGKLISPSRYNGLSGMVRRIRYDALAYNIKLS